MRVKWEYCTMSQLKGGMGIINSREMADKMAVKWIFKGLLSRSEIRAQLMLRKSDKLGLKGKEKWLNLPDISIWARKGP